MMNRSPARCQTRAKQFSVCERQKGGSLEIASLQPGGERRGGEEEEWNCCDSMTL